MTRRKTEAAPTLGARMSTKDRDAASLFLERARTPAQTLVQANGSEIYLFAALHFVEIAMEIARPLSPALRERVKLWTGELERRREQILIDIRNFNARQPDSSSAQRHGATR